MMNAETATPTATGTLFRLGLFVVLAFLAGAAVAVAVGDRDSGKTFKMTYLRGEVKAVSIDGRSLCLVQNGRSKEVCAPPALTAGQQMPKVGDSVFVARATAVREGEPDGLRHFVYLFPTLPPAMLQP